MDAAATGSIVEGYEQASSRPPKVGLLIAAMIALGALFMTRNLPADGLEDEAAPPPAPT